MRGFAQYILKVRAAGLSGPDVLQAASHAFRIHALAFAKSETYTCRYGQHSLAGTDPRLTYQDAELEGIETEGGLVVNKLLLLQ